MNVGELRTQLETLASDLPVMMNLRAPVFVAGLVVQPVIDGIGMVAADVVMVVSDAELAEIREESDRERVNNDAPDNERDPSAHTTQEDE